VFERTLVIVKPGGVARDLVNEIRRHETARLSIVTIKKLTATQELIPRHYPAEGMYLLSLAEKAKTAGVDLDARGKQLAFGMAIVNGHRNFMTSGPVLAFVVGGENAVKRVRAITGYTDLARAEKGTIRGDFAEDPIEIANRDGRPVQNLVHASGTIGEAEAEIKFWFGELSGG
jgi:nucleoside-diphosphate kinase